MSSVLLSRVVRGDAADLIAVNRESQQYHLPWVTSFTDQPGFESWFAKGLCGPNVGLIAREVQTGAILGVININEIVAGVFQSAYIGYYGMVRFSGKGLMTAALRAASGSARKVIRLAICGSMASGTITSGGRCLRICLANMQGKYFDR